MSQSVNKKSVPSRTHEIIQKRNAIHDDRVIGWHCITWETFNQQWHIHYLVIWRCMAVLIYFFQYPSYHVHVEGSECTLEEKGPKKVSSLAIGEQTKWSLTPSRFSSMLTIFQHPRDCVGLTLCLLDVAIDVDFCLKHNKYFPQSISRDFLPLTFF